MTFQEALSELGAMRRGETKKINGRKIERRENGRFVDLSFADFYPHWQNYSRSKTEVAYALCDVLPPSWELRSIGRKESFFRYGTRSLRGGKWKRRKGRWGRHEFKTQGAERAALRNRLRP